ncbi:hypothetical protein [Streptomyces sp. NPDC048659]|uniref:hypothetical protein n=1 Tax=Streptomyces sp. NPDC048659 TaxID=3155489 RepID=UPI00341AAD42
MEAELVTLATAGATALVQQMVTEGWERARTRIAGYFAARSGADEAAIGEELDAAREDLLSAERSGDPDAAAEAQSEARTEWRARMRRSLLADPNAAGELRRILDELSGPDSSAPAPHTTVITNTMTGGVHHGITIQAGTIGDVGRIGHVGHVDRTGGGTPAEPSGPSGQGGPRP